ncbi:hypothetical protein HS041_09795 [Planomonospora sp. ID67723]|uniref:sensor histidine kinase n=1 Tax=Planomonospora sp. ID67723 TaxID=2738134 RepID=UPI0018C37E1E|nr:histidine kinase [Planomonospora sp. ID67723]MBG0828059.1 hypothetical protein [Planomonospora sp. ID67723]
MDVTTKPSRAEERLAALDIGRAVSSRLTDVAVAAVLAVAALLQVAADHTATALPSALLATAPLAIRRSHPWPAVALTFLGAVGLVLAGVYEPPIAVAVSGVLSLYTILRRLSRPAAWTLVVCLGGAFAAIVMATAYLWSWPYLWSGLWSGGLVVVLFTGVVATTALLADVRRSRTEIKEVRADNLEVLQEQAAMAERARIAREMHDIVAHSISMVAVQAETAPYTLPGLDDRVKQEFAEIATSARSTLTEMRRLLGVLRADITTAPETAPQPGLARLPS